MSEMGAFMALLALGPVSVEMTLSAYGLIVADLNSDATGWQISFATYFAGYALGQMTFGLIADLVGRKSAIISALTLFSVASLLCATTTTMEEFAVYRFGQALGVGAGPLLVRVMLRDRRSMGEAAQWISIFGCFLGFLQLIAPSLGAMTALSLGWRFLFAEQAVLGMGIALFFAYWSRVNLPSEPELSREPGFFTEYVVTIIDAQCLRNALPMSFIFSGVLVLTTSSPTVLIGQFSVSPEVFSLQFAAILLAMVLGMFCNRYLVRVCTFYNINFFATVAASVGCGTVLMIVIMAGASESAFMLACMVFAFCSGFVVPNGAIQVMGADGRRFGGRAAVAGGVQYSIVAGVIFLSGVLGPSAEAIVSLLVSLALITLVVQLHPKLRASRHT